MFVLFVGSLAIMRPKIAADWLDLKWIALIDLFPGF